MIVKTEKLSRRYGPVTALNLVSLEIPDHEIYCLVGPSGSGKTTLVRILNGLETPSSGSAEVLGEPLPRGHRRVAARIGYMPQEVALYRDLTVQENMEFFGEIYGLRGADLGRRIRELLRFMGMEAQARQTVETLSGGQLRRTSLACALLHGPELLFLDEPTVGFDPPLRDAFWEYFSRLKAAGATILITTHYMEEAERVDRVGMLRDGKLIAQGTPSDLKKHAGVGTMEEAFKYYLTGACSGPLE